jgi:hypothetical protein
MTFIDLKINVANGPGQIKIKRIKNSKYPKVHAE